MSNCIRCQEKPADVFCDCLVLDQKDRYEAVTGGLQVTTTEYATNIESAGLCEDCARFIAKTEPQIIFPKLWHTCVLIGIVLLGACLALLAIWLFLQPGDTRTVIGRIGLFGALILIVVFVIARSLLQRAAANRRSDRDRLLIATVLNHAMSGKPIYRRYVPLCKEYYPNYNEFRKMNLGIMENNAKEIYKRFIESK